MNIRPATPEDVPAVLPMVGKIAAFHEQLDPAKYAVRGDPVKAYDRWLFARAKDPRSVFLVADSALANEPAKLVGFLVAGVQDEIPIYQITENGFIYDLWVEESYR